MSADGVVGPVVSVATVVIAGAPGNAHGGWFSVSVVPPGPCCAVTTTPRNTARLIGKIHWNIRIVSPPEDTRIIAQPLRFDGSSPWKILVQGDETAV